MANSDPLVDGPPTKKAKIGGDANGKNFNFTKYFISLNFIWIFKRLFMKHQKHFHLTQ